MERPGALQQARRPGACTAGQHQGCPHLAAAAAPWRPSPAADLPFWAPLVTTRLLKFTSVPGEAMYSILGQYAAALFGRHLKGEAGAAGEELLEGRRLLEGVTFE